MMGLGFDALVLTTIGRKTGAERTTPVGRFPDKHGSWLIVASAAGAPRHPAWHYNLAAHPDKVQIEMAGRKIALTAEQLHGVEREEAWQQITAAVPRFAKYQQNTDRELPVSHPPDTPIRLNIGCITSTCLTDHGGPTRFAGRPSTSGAGDSGGFARPQREVGYVRVALKGARNHVPSAQYTGRRQ